MFLACYRLCSASLLLRDPFRVARFVQTANQPGIENLLSLAEQPRICPRAYFPLRSSYSPLRIEPLRDRHDDSKCPSTLQ